jgi:hypothetical protein
MNNSRWPQIIEHKQNLMQYILQKRVVWTKFDIYIFITSLHLKILEKKHLCLYENKLWVLDQSHNIVWQVKMNGSNESVPLMWFTNVPISLSFACLLVVYSFI